MPDDEWYDDGDQCFTQHGEEGVILTRPSKEEIEKITAELVSKAKHNYNLRSGNRSACIYVKNTDGSKSQKTSEKKPAPAKQVDTVKVKHVKGKVWARKSDKVNPVETIEKTTSDKPEEKIVPPKVGVSSSNVTLQKYEPVNMMHLLS